MNTNLIFYRRNPPYFQPSDALYFITFRLANSIPKSVLQELSQERRLEEQTIKSKNPVVKQKEPLYRLHKRYFARYDDWLDGCVESPSWLADARLAAIVAKAINDFNHARYLLLTYCIMPNHVHLVLDLSGFSQVSISNEGGKTRGYPLSDALRLLKGRTARLCNQMLGRNGTFWHHESYDHVLRDQHELGRTIQYCLYNPVKAGLVDDWHRWKFSYVDPEFGDW